MVLKWSLKWSSESTAAESRAWSTPWETLNLLSLRRDVLGGERGKVNKINIKCWHSRPYALIFESVL